MRNKTIKYPEEFIIQIFKEVEGTGNATLITIKHDIVPCTVTR
ncbi:hypothetical protein NE686_19785 [Tissierella carlieri]|uniref:Transposase n=1 Tax=Tissierella carlieri TaxID=689904 RepID=A0ABT1SFS9_9FIRM|nr:hypothetical protein [Tissierella carlieri]MCQ4925355.1 hypothetical protein [Tissierella carlieri]